MQAQFNLDLTLGIWQKLTTINDSRHLAKIFLTKQKTSFSTVSLLQASFCQIPHI